MKLSEYLQTNHLTQNQFISICKEKSGHSFSQGSVSKWILEKRRPRSEECKVIYNCTNGEVSPNDFYL